MIWIWAQVYDEYIQSKYYYKHKHTTIFTIRMNTSWITLNTHHHIICIGTMIPFQLYIISTTCRLFYNRFVFCCWFFSLLLFLFQFKNFWYTFIVSGCISNCAFSTTCYSNGSYCLSNCAVMCNVQCMDFFFVSSRFYFTFYVFTFPVYRIN